MEAGSKRENQSPGWKANFMKQEERSECQCGITMRIQEKIVRQNTGSPAIQNLGFSLAQDSEKALIVSHSCVESCLYGNSSIKVSAHSGSVHLLSS